MAITEINFPCAKWETKHKTKGYGIFIIISRNSAPPPTTTMLHTQLVANSAHVAHVVQKVYNIGKFLSIFYLMNKNSESSKDKPITYV